MIELLNVVESCQGAKWLTLGRIISFAPGMVAAKYAISGVSSESDRSLQVQTEVLLSIVESRGPLIDPCY